LFAHACKLGFEGIISRKADAPYRSERSGAWVKVKCVQRAKFPIVGFVKDPTGVSPDGTATETEVLRTQLSALEQLYPNGTRKRHRSGGDCKMVSYWTFRASLVKGIVLGAENLHRSGDWVSTLPDPLSRTAVESLRMAFCTAKSSVAPALSRPSLKEATL